MEASQYEEIVRNTAEQFESVLKRLEAKAAEDMKFIAEIKTEYCSVLQQCPCLSSVSHQTGFRRENQGYSP